MTRFLIPLLASGLLVACGGGNSSAPADQTAKLADADPAIMQLYNRSCISCHARGSGGAPRTGDRAAWQPRLEQGMDVLLDHTIGGYKGMPPMGMCMDCTPEQFEKLINYMTGQAAAAS